MNYKYIFVDNNSEITRSIYSDVLKLQNVIYTHISDAAIEESAFVKLIFKISQWFHKQNELLNYMRYLSVIKQYRCLDPQERVCFVYFDLTREVNMLVYRYNLKKYTEIKNVMIYTDTHRLRKSCIESDKKLFDALYTYDNDESVAQNIIYTPLPYSILDIETDEKEECDICFVGAPKTRFIELVQLFRFLTDNGVKCQFYFTCVDDSMRIYKDEIHYVNYIPYNETVRIIKYSNCVVEITYSDSTFVSQRVLEGIAYGKKILTNNKNIISENFFISSAIQIYNDIHQIDLAFIKEKQEIDYHYKDEISPCRFIESLENTVCNE